MSRALIRTLVILSVIAIVGILTVQAVWLRRAYALSERQFRQTAFVALQEVADAVARLNKITQTRSAVTQLSSDYFVVRTDAPIDPVLLEHYLQDAFRRHRLLTDFEYGIYNCDSEQMVYGAYVSTQVPQPGKATGKRVSKARTHPKFPGYTYYFEIRFPGQGSIVAGQLDGWLVSSAAVGCYQFDRANTVVRRDELLRSLDVFNSRHRKRLADDPTIRIEGVHGVGFRLVCLG